MIPRGVEEELVKAVQAKEMGLDGRARVCARRAAGLAAAYYLQQKQIPAEGKNSYEKIQILNQLPGIPGEIRTVTANLLRRVNSDYQLPAEIDLISDTRKLIQFLAMNSDSLDTE